jgi:hypothetical protein
MSLARERAVVIATAYAGSGPRVAGHPAVLGWAVGNGGYVLVSA